MQYARMLLLSLCVVFTTQVRAGGALRYVYEIESEADERGNGYYWRAIPFKLDKSDKINESDKSGKSDKVDESNKSDDESGEVDKSNEMDETDEINKTNEENEIDEKNKTDEANESDAFALFQFFFDTVRYCVPENVRVLSVRLSGGTLTVNVSDDILRYGGNAFERALIAQCLATAAGLSNVTHFTLMVNGRVQSLTEGRIVLDRPLSNPLDSSLSCD